MNNVNTFILLCWYNTEKKIQRAIKYGGYSTIAESGKSKILIIFYSFSKSFRYFEPIISVPVP